MLKNVQYLVVEGVIGVGKTSLVEILANILSAEAVFEQSVENPFLSNFYKDKQKYAFQTQLWFLLSRYRQITEMISQQNLFHKITVSDYMFAKDKIFAHVNLDENELSLYNRIASLLERDIIKPDFVVYLQASTEVLLERIELRGRPFEKNMNRDYVETLNQAYNHFFFHYKESPVLIVDTNDIDFVRNSEELDEIVTQIQKLSAGTRYYRPLGKKGLNEMERRRNEKQ